MPEVIPIGADHAGYALKERLVTELRRLGYEPLDLGTHSTESTDYPDYAHEVGARGGGGVDPRSGPARPRAQRRQRPDPAGAVREPGGRGGDPEDLAGDGFRR